MIEDGKVPTRRKDDTKVGVVVGLMMIAAAALAVVVGVMSRDGVAAKGFREHIKHRPMVGRGA